MKAVAENIDTAIPHYEMDAVARWQRAFDEAIHLASTGLFEKEIIEAKKVFFLRLGASHEMKPDVFEAASRSFLEWYLFDYPTRQFGKSALISLLLLESLTNESAEVLNRALHHRWSLYRVKDIRSDHLVLDDLIVGVQRRLWLDRESVDAKIWRLEKKQIIQARLFPLTAQTNAFYFMSHPWIHPASERALLVDLSKKQHQSWKYPQEFLIDCFETAVRSHNIQNQVRAAKRENWYYQELKKRYAPKK